MKNIKSEFLIEFIEKGLPDIQEQLEKVKQELTDLEKVSKKISISKNIVKDLKEVKNTIKLLNKELSLLSKAKFGNFKQVETHLSILTTHLSKIRRVTNEVNALKTAVLQTKKAVIELNRVKLDNLEKTFKKISIVKDLKSIRAKNTNNSSIKDLIGLNKDLAKQENIMRQIGRLTNEFEAVYNEFIRGNKKQLKKITSVNFNKVKQEFSDLQEEAKNTLNITPLRDFVKDFKSISLTWSSAVRGSYKQAKEFQNLFKALSKINNPTAAKLSKNTVQSTKQLINYTQMLIDKTKRANANLKQHLNTRRIWAKSDDIKEAEKTIDEYTKKIKILENIQKSLNKRVKKQGKFLSHVEFENYSKALEQTTKQISTLNHKIVEIRSNLNQTSGIKYLLQSTKTAITYASLYTGLFSIFQVIHNSVSYIIQFNNATKQLQAVLKLTGKEATTLETRIAHLGTIYGGTIEDINKASLALARAGVETQKVVKATEIVIKMAKLTGDSFETSANALITFMTVYKDSGVSIQQLGDELAYVANQSKLSTDDINTFANYALQTAKAVGITRHYIEAMAIAFSNAGTRAQTIGTAIRRLGTLATDNSTAIQSFFKKIGISQQTFAYLLTRSSKDSTRVMTELTQKLASLSDEEFSKATSNMEILAKQSLTLLRQNADEIVSQYQQLSNGVAGELNQANVVTESYLGTWERLKNTFGEVFNSISQRLFPMIEKLGYSLINTLQTIEAYMPQILNYFSEFKKIIKDIFIAVGSVFAIKGITKLSTEFSELITKGNILKGVIEGIGVALSALSKNPIGLLISGLTIAGVEIYNYLNKAQQVAKITNPLEENLKNQIELRKNLVKYDELMATYKRLEKKLQYDIIKGNQIEAQKDRDKLAFLLTKLRLTKELIDKQQYNLNLDEKKKKIVEEYTKYQMALLKLRDLQNKANKTKEDKSTIKRLEAFIKPYKNSLKSLEEFSKAYERLNKHTKQQIQNQKTIFTISNKIINKYNQLKSVISSLDKQGIDVTNSIKLYHKNLLKTLSDGIEGFKTLVKNTFKDIFSTQPIENQGISNQINKILGMIDKAKTINDINDIQNAVLKLQLSIKGITNEKTRANLEEFISVLKENLVNIQTLAGKDFEKIKISPNELQIKPALNEAQREKFNEKILNIYKKIKDEKLKIASLDTNMVLPVENKLKNITQQRQYYEKRLNEVKQKRLNIQRQLQSVINRIKSMDNLPKTVKNQNKLNELSKKKNTLQNQLNSLVKEENNLQQNTLNTELKKLEIMRQQKEALVELHKETLRNLNLSDFFISLKQNVNSVKTKIGLVDGSSDKKKVKEFLNWLDSKIQQKNKQLRNDNYNLMNNIFGLTGSDLGISADISNIMNTYTNMLDDIKHYYSEKKNLIEANELALKEKLKAGQISELEYHKQMYKLQENMERLHQEKMQKIRLASFNKSLGVTREFLTNSLNIMEQLHQVGYLKAKKWAYLYKSIRVAQTIIDTYASAQKAMADPALPYPMNYAVAAMSVATGMARLAVIKAQKFHTGGYVDRKQFNNTSMGGLRDDEIPTILQKGEYVLSRKDVELIKQSVNPNVNVTANAPSPEVIIVNDVNDEKFAEYLQSRQGREIIRNVIH